MNTDNQQQTVSDFEIGWITGIIEGEGSIVLLVSKRNGRSQQLRVIPRVIMANTDMQLVEKYIDILTRLGIGRYVCFSRQNNRKASRLLSAGGNIPKFKDITCVTVAGFKRMNSLLSVITPNMHGEKKLRASLLLKFIQKRIGDAHAEGKAANRLYDQADVKIMLEFLELTASPNKIKIAGMLNEHTREARREQRRQYKRDWCDENRAKINELRRNSRRSRCALNSREIVRGKQKCSSAALRGGQ